LLSLVLTPVLAAAGYRWWGVTYYGWSDDVPPVSRALRFVVEPMLNLAPREEVYPTYGKTLILVFVLMLLGALGLRAALGEQLTRGGKIGLWLVIIGLVMQILGNIGDYWLGYEVLQQPLWGLSFAVGSGVGFLVCGAGSIMLGIALLRRKLLPGWAAWPLIITPPLGIVFMFFGVYHVPSSWVLPMSVAWLLLGLALLLRPSSVAAGESDGQAVETAAL
jgi:hypothetical protein